VLRWRGIWEHYTLISTLIDGKTLDFGGSDGPLLGADVCDIQGDAIYRDLSEVPDRHYDCVFTSHTLEHVPDPVDVLKQFHRVTGNQGAVVVHVPAYTCERWRPENYANPNQGTPHLHAFKLDWDDRCDCKAMSINQEVARIFPGMIISEYVGDNSILIAARK
jgi:SAM-dependent methyltransferase